MKFNEVKVGDVFYYDNFEKSKYSPTVETDDGLKKENRIVGVRPWLILGKSQTQFETLTVIPMSSKHQDGYIKVPTLTNKSSYAIVGQLYTINASQLDGSSYIGNIGTGWLNIIIDAVKSSLDGACGKLSSLCDSEDTNDTIEVANEEIKEDTEVGNSEVVDLYKNYTDALQRVISLIDDKNDLKEEVSRLKANGNSSNIENIEETEQFKECLGKHTEKLENQYKIKQEELNKKYNELVATFEESEKAVKDREVKVNAREKEIEKNGSLNTLRKDLADTQAKYQNELNRSRCYRGDRDKYKAAMDKLDKQAQALKTQIASLETKNRQMKMELDDCKSQVELSNSSQNKAQSTVNELNRTLQLRDNRIKQLTKENKELMALVEQYRKSDNAKKLSRGYINWTEDKAKQFIEDFNKEGIGYIEVHWGFDKKTALKKLSYIKSKFGLEDNREVTEEKENIIEEKEDTIEEKEDTVEEKEDNLEENSLISADIFQSMMM